MTSDRPSLTHAIIAEDGTETVIKMSHGLMNDLLRMTPDPAQVISAIMGDPFTQDYIVRRVLTPLRETVTDPENQLVKEVDLNIEQELALLEWVADTLLHFFARQAESMSRLGQKFKDATAQLNPSPAGSPA